MQELNFEQLPNVNFPFELLVMSYPDLVVGGYQSSVFISVPCAVAIHFRRVMDAPDEVFLWAQLLVKRHSH